MSTARPSVSKTGTDRRCPHGFDRAGEGSLAVCARKGLPAQVRPDGTARLTWTCASAPGDDRRRASSERLTAEDLSGQQQFRTASGDIELARVSGSVAIEAASGDVALVATGELRLRARTVSGDLEVRAGRLAEVSAATTSGDLAIAGERSGRNPPDRDRQRDTILALAGGARIEVSTVTGDVSADVPQLRRSDGRRVVVVGDGRARLVAAPCPATFIS